MLALYIFFVFLWTKCVTRLSNDFQKSWAGRARQNAGHSLRNEPNRLYFSAAHRGRRPAKVEISRHKLWLQLFFCRCYHRTFGARLNRPRGAWFLKGLPSTPFRLLNLCHSLKIGAEGRDFEIPRTKARNGAEIACPFLKMWGISHIIAPAGSQMSLWDSILSYFCQKCSET